MPARLSWAVLLGLVAASSSCASTRSSAAPCETDKLPKDDPCYNKGCCESVFVPGDGGTDGGADAGTYRMCGACNG